MIDYELLKARDNDGPYHSLKNHGVDQEVSTMSDMGAETMAPPLDENIELEQDDNGIFASARTVMSMFPPSCADLLTRYKAPGTTVTDDAGVKDKSGSSTSRRTTYDWPSRKHLSTFARIVNLCRRRMDGSHAA